MKDKLEKNWKKYMKILKNNNEDLLFEFDGMKMINEILKKR